MSSIAIVMSAMQYVPAYRRQLQTAEHCKDCTHAQRAPGSYNARTFQVYNCWWCNKGHFFTSQHASCKHYSNLTTAAPLVVNPEETQA